MIIRIQNERGVYLNLKADVTWTVPASGKHGEATFEIPRVSAAWSDDVIDPRGGFLVDIVTPYGVWQGVADLPQWKPAGMTVKASHITRWPELRRVGTGTYIGCLAGHIVKRGFLDAMSNLGAMALKLGHIVYAGPVIEEPIQFNGQPFLQVLNRLSELTGQEWVIDDDGRFHWLAHAGEYHDLPPIVDDGWIFPTLNPGTLNDRAAITTEQYDDGRFYRVYSDDQRPLWLNERIERV